MLGNLTLMDLALLVLVWFLTSMVANLLWTRFVLMKYTGRAFMSWLEDVLAGKDDRGNEVMCKLAYFFFNWAANAKLKTGKRLKVATDKVDAEGNPEIKEIDEEVTPIDMMGRTIGNYALMKIKGSNGGAKAQIGREIQDALGEGNPLGLSPAAMKALLKGELGPAIMEVGMPKLMEMLNKRKTNTSTGGGW